MASANDPLAVDLEQNALDLVAQEIILSASRHEIATLRGLLRDSSSAAPANVKDAETGHTPLHAAIASMADDESATKGVVNGDSAEEADAEDDQESEMGRAVRTVQLLLQNGAIWNSLDANDETPGCLAWRLGLRRLYDMVVDAGVRTELLFQRLDGYEPLGDDDGDEFQADGEAEAVDGAAAPEGERQAEDGDASLGNQQYLSSRLTFTSNRLLDSSSNAVMMEWERDIMSRSVDHIMPSAAPENDEITVLNIGHGMGIIDSIFQSHSPRPAVHHIIEAHPSVVARMKQPGGFLETHKDHKIVVHEGRWQDVLPRLAEQQVTFDAIYFDTFAEDYSAFRTFFEEWVIALLKEGGRWSFFHGLGADRRVCYDVYTKVAEMDLFEAGFDVEWEKIAVPNLAQAGEWEGIRRSYWELDEYRLPTCTFLG